MPTSRLRIAHVDHVMVENLNLPQEIYLVTTPDDKHILVDSQSLCDWLVSVKVDKTTARKITDLVIEGYGVVYDGQEATLTGKLSFPTRWEYP